MDTKTLLKSLSLFCLGIVFSLSAQAQYCTATYSTQCNNFDMYIQNFSTTGGASNITNNASGCGNTSNSYTHYSTLAHVGPPTSTVNFSVTIGASYPQGVLIWVDWNQDGDFTDAGENVYAPSSTIAAGGTATGNFTVPITATIGTTRMRVRSSYATTGFSSCGSQSYGECEDYNFIVASSCTAVSSVNILGFGSQSVQFDWPAVTGSLGYEYAVTTSSTGPATGTTASGLSALVTGLTPSTLYYVHVRNKCAQYPSMWTTTNFTTLPPCVVQPKFQVPYVDTNSATVTWQATPTALDFKYFVTTDSTFPTSTAGASLTSTNSFFINQLSPGTVYYVFVMARCLAGDSSAWVRDSFYVPNPCRAPEVKFDGLNNNRAIAYWSEQITAYEYEIINSSSAMSNPVSGIKLTNLSYMFPYLDAGKTYYVYARSYCEDRGIETLSPWSTATYNTWPLTVGNANNTDGAIQLYPNPVQNQLTINISGEFSATDVIKVIDYTGKVLLVKEVSGNNMTIDVNMLAAGAYMLQYTNDTNSTYVKFNKM